jgi:hypothetical protein
VPGYDAHDLALHEATSPGRGLLADRDRVSRREESRDVWLCGVRREAAERDLVGVAAIARRERQVEVARRDLGVGEKHLVEVAQAEEEDRALMLRLDAEILREEPALPAAAPPLPTDLHPRRHGHTRLRFLVR